MKIPKLTLSVGLLNLFALVLGFFLITFPEGVLADPTLPLYFNILGAFVIGFSVLIIIFVEHRLQLGKEHHFLRFLNNISKAVSKGEDLASSIVQASTRSYGAASSFLAHFFSDISRGVSLDRALGNLSKEMHSRLISRINCTIRDILRLKYDLSKALPGLVENYLEIRKIKQKRGFSREDAVIKGYLVFLLFLFLFVSLTAFVIPLITTEAHLSTDVCSLKVLSLFFILIQSLYGGLIMGKISEGSVLAGLKHAAVHIAVASVFIRMFLGINLADMFLISMGFESAVLLCG